MQEADDVAPATVIEETLPPRTVVARDPEVDSVREELRDVNEKLDGIGGMGGPIAMISAGGALLVSGVAGGAFLLTLDDIAHGSDGFFYSGSSSADARKTVAWTLIGVGAAVGGSLLTVGIIMASRRAAARRPYSRRADELEEWLDDVKDAQESGIQLDGFGVDPKYGVLSLSGRF